MHNATAWIVPTILYTLWPFKSSTVQHMFTIWSATYMYWPAIQHSNQRDLQISYFSCTYLQAIEYAEDPLVYHGGMKAKFINEFLNAMGRARDNLHLISLPLFLMHGERDRLVPISASQFVQKNIGSESKTYEVSQKSMSQWVNVQCMEGEEYTCCVILTILSCFLTCMYCTCGCMWTTVM